MRLVDADWLEEHLNLYSFNTRDDIRKFINNAPVKCGKWIRAPYTNERICSECEHREPYKFADEEANVYNFCPHCGASMQEVVT